MQPIWFDDVGISQTGQCRPSRLVKQETRKVDKFGDQQGRLSDADRQLADDDDDRQGQLEDEVVEDDSENRMIDFNAAMQNEDGGRKYRQGNNFRKQNSDIDQDQVRKTADP